MRVGTARVQERRLSMSDQQKPICIRWRDTSAHPGWYDEMEYQTSIKEPVMVMQSLGWLLHESDDCVVIAQSKSDGRVGEMLKIPREAIVGIDTVKVSPNGKQSNS